MSEQTFDFSELLNDLDAGIFVEKVSRIVAETAEAVIYQDGKDKVGKVKLELTLARIGNSSQIELEHKIVYSKPTPNGKAGEENTTSTALYVGKRGKLSIMPDTQTDFFSTKNEENS